jgi:hypothetical protein
VQPPADPGVRQPLASPGSAGALRATLPACVHLTSTGVFAMGVAAIARGTALPLGIMSSLLFPDSQGLGNVPGVRTAARYLPDRWDS